MTQTARAFLSFCNTTGSPYHSVEASIALLKQKNFVRLFENEDWTGRVERGGKYFVTRNHSVLGVFSVGQDFSTGKSGFDIVAAHTDSPCLRIRPSHKLDSEGCFLLGVECYGGGLWHTWFDRGLGVAGKVVYKDGKTLRERLVRIDRPVCILPNLAIHLQNADERAAFKVNKESHLRPVLSTLVYHRLLEPVQEAVESAAGETLGENNPTSSKASPPPYPLFTCLANEINIDASQIVDVDLCLFDATEGRICGINEEFVESGRLDNLVSVFAAVRAIADIDPSASDINKSSDSKSTVDISTVFAFDFEEVGSTAYTGADSCTPRDWMERMVEALAENYTLSRNAFQSVLSRSFCLSVDMAHAVHPNYKEKHQTENKPLLHKGIVIKENCNQRYASNAVSIAMLRTIATNAGVPVQNFVVRNDSPCGSTVGPTLSSSLGVRVIDIGVPQWAMHSIRETCGVTDIEHLRKLLENFFRSFRIIDDDFRSLE
eukprot:GHVU01117593.1.p1 GENE.GHVU01117593.1~~GHVU01117593.1.p1  ORF type:complete len:511 (+),score=39.61 GHVU01117593.1:67-1533(+)